MRARRIRCGTACPSPSQDVFVVKASSSIARRTSVRGVATLGLVLSSVASAAPGGAPVEAIWHKQQLEFSFKATNISYSCAGLQRKLGSILTAVGVHHALGMACFGGATRALQVRLQMEHAVEATEENVRKATSFDATSRLRARLKNEQLPSAADIPRFMAHWRRVDLHRERKLRLEPGDCELLRQVRTQIFSKLSVRIEQDGLGCHSGVATRIPHPLRVMALLPQAGQGVEVE
jgi:hypothetical protein